MQHNKNNSVSLILYELNEVPKKLIDKYVQIKPNSAFAKLLKEGKLINTITYDTGELHPWTTWPTLHRGINNDKHNIKFLNQPLDESEVFPPIWNILQKNDIKIGVFGSLQSYPPLKAKNVSFFLPDTFAPTPDAFPSNLKTFQEFNLKICSENKAISEGISKNLYFKFLELIIKRILSFKTLSRVIIHYLKEKLNCKYRKRRALIQPILGFDLFFKSLDKYKPRFSTFFTNHVAGIIHRYWRDLFPEDFNSSNIYETNKFNKDSVIKAMDIADRQINKLMKYCDKNSINLWIASSMGQKKREEIALSIDIQIFDMQLFLESINLNPNHYVEKPAMQPDICIEYSNENDFKKLTKNLESIRDVSGNKIIEQRYKNEGKVVNLSIKMTKDLVQNRIIKINEKIKNPENIGIKFISRDPGTAYHTPEGIFIMYGSETHKYKFSEKEFLDTTKIAPMILDIFNIKNPSYMNKF